MSFGKRPLVKKNYFRFPTFFMAHPLVATEVTSFEELLQIEALNAENLKPGLTAGEISQQGFVTWRYDIDLLQQLHTYAPSVICKSGSEVAGYALTTPRESAAVHPELSLMLDKINGLPYEGKPLREYSYYVMGQLCVAKPYRGRGVVEMMYGLHRDLYSSQYDMMVLTISTENTRSVRVHERFGFTDIHVYNDHFGAWKVCIWDWRNQSLKSSSNSNRSA
ncbi:MAG: hypothetical protein RL732_86 [Bacteroidota bacterium]|jgi:ribosomal protein S18 acetylase RimI-like enzyme